MNYQNHFFITIFMLIILLGTILFFFRYHGKNKSSTLKRTLWTHLIYTEVKPKNGVKDKYNRKTTISHGLFNQLYSLFSAVNVASILERDLVVNKFYVSFMDTTNGVPLSKVVDLSSLLVPTTDWNNQEEPKPSKIINDVYDPPPNSLEILLQEHHIPNLEVGCMFNLRILDYKKDPHIQKVRFHPIFYEITSSFLTLYPKYQVVHYRMENDFAGYFHQRFGYKDVAECQSNILQKYQKTLEDNFDYTIPTLIVSYYYKDKNQPRNFDLKWKNLVHYTITKKQREQLYHHLELPNTMEMREIDAIIDFILSTSPNVSGFVGIDASTFSDSIVSYWNNKNCVLIQPQK